MSGKELASGDDEQPSQAKRRRSIQSQSASEYGLGKEDSLESDGVLIDPLGRPYPPGHWDATHQDPRLGFGGTIESGSQALPVYDELCEAVDRLGGCMATPQGALHGELCVRALNELLHSNAINKAELVIGVLDMEGDRCVVEGHPPVILTAVTVPPFPGLRSVWGKLLELQQDPDEKYQSLSPNEAAARVTMNLRQALQM
jgi:hypothetical protein